jgi:hypothetical protein|tara:strand:+ start:290 stop:517 length:228 start_codon:yes stop_codon:yes gene_type:complete
MANTSLKRIRTFIEMYDKQDSIHVEDDEFGCQVYYRQSSVEWGGHNIYECKNINAASELVNCIIFDLPINATPAE